MNNIITCPKCHRVLPISDYFTFKDKQLYTGMCKSCAYKRIDVNDLSTFLPFMELFDIPYIESQWNRLIALAERSSPFDVAPASRVFGKYLSLMKLRGYIDFSFKDSEELNKIERWTFFSLDERCGFDRCVFYARPDSIDTEKLIDVIENGGTGDIKYSMESVHTGGKNIKPDNIILINANASIAKKWMEEDKFGGRQENVLAIKNLQQKLSGINDGFIIYTTAKNYTLNKRFQEVLNGYPAGKMTSLQNFNAAAWNIEINTDALITTVMQLIPGAVGEGDDEAVKTALSRAIAAALFDDFNTIGQEVNIGGSLTSIHLFDLQGVLMPFSYYLQLLGDAFTSVGGFGNINDERIRQLISVDIEVPPSIMFPTQAQQNLYYIATGNNPWNAQAKDALNNSRIGFHFLAGLRSILEGLFN